MKRYCRLGRLSVFGARVYVHWSVLATLVVILALCWRNPIIVTIAMLSFFSIILVHEIGHAAVAKQLGYRVRALRICLIHGVCEYQEPYYEWDDILIAWGGILAQILVAIVVFALSSLGAGKVQYFAPVVFFLGYYNLLVIPLNLIPSPGLDGYKAWRIIPLGYKEIKYRLDTGTLFTRNKRRKRRRW
jgi:Zn-dependent protease